MVAMLLASLRLLIAGDYWRLLQITTDYYSIAWDYQGLLEIYLFCVCVCVCNWYRCPCEWCLIMWVLHILASSCSWTLPNGMMLWTWLRCGSATIRWVYLLGLFKAKSLLISLIPIPSPGNETEWAICHVCTILCRSDLKLLSHIFTFFSWFTSD